MAQWIFIEYGSPEVDAEVTSPMPKDGQIVELQLDDGSVVKSMFSFDGPDDWDFVENNDALPSVSYLDRVVAWRPITGR